MDDVTLAERIARLLSWVWLAHRQPAFLDYLAATYGEAVAELPLFEQLCITEAEYGDAEKGAIGGILKRWWLADSDGFRSIPSGRMPRFVEDFNDAEGTGRLFYRFPLVKFLREGSTITFGEAFGPRLRCRKVGRVQHVNGNLAIVDVRLIWNVKFIGTECPPPQVPSGFDLKEDETPS